MRSVYSTLWRVTRLAVACLTVALAGGCGRKGILAPVGQSSGVIQFDATIEITPPLSPNSIALFARYWVCSNYYRVAVVWGEPGGERMCFPIYPPTLRFASDSGTFSITDDLFPKHDRFYEKPVGDRGVFSNMYGDYPPRNLRFVDSSADAERIHTSDLSDLLEHRFIGPEGANWIETTNSKLRERVARIAVGITNDEMDSLQLLGKDGRSLAKFDYVYDSADHGLARELAAWPEQPITTGFAEGAIHVKVGGKQFDYNRFGANYESGGRTAEVDYGAIPTGDGMARLPVRITVRDAATGELLRSARLSNFQLVRMDRTEVDRAAASYAGFSPLEMQYREYLRKYWSSSSSSLTPEDDSAMKRARDEFDEELAAVRGKSVGEELKCVHMALDLNRMLGDKGRFAACYERYLSILAANGLTNMVYEAGYIAVRAAAGWDRHEAANGLLKKWVTVLTGLVGDEEVIRLVERDAERGNLWANFLLLDACNEEDARSATLRFERTALQSVILGQLINQLSGKATVQRPPHGVTASEPPLESLLQMFDERVAIASACFTNMQKVSEANTALKRRLDELVEARNGRAAMTSPAARSEVTDSVFPNF